MMMFNNIVSNLAQATERTQEIQEVITSMKKINRLSDDPVGISKVVDYESHLSKLGQYKENITYGNSWLSMTDSVLLDMQNLVTEAKTIAIAQSTETATSETRQQAAVAVRNLYEQMINFANTKLGGSYIFGGSLTNSPPFNSDGTYNGNADDILIEIMEGIKAKINVAGSDFLMTDLNPALSTDPATAGSTSSAGLVARNSNTIVGGFGGTTVENLSNYQVTVVLNNGMSQEITYTTDGDATQDELGAGIADAVNGHDVLNQYIRAAYDPATGGIAFEAKEAGEEGNGFTIDEDNTTAFEVPINTSFAGGAREISTTDSFTITAGLNDNFFISVDGGAPAFITITPGTYTPAALAAEMQAQIGGSVIVDFDASVSGQFTITSTATGINSTVSLTSGTNDFLRTVGLERDFEVSGTSPTFLADLNGGNGVSTGTIDITDREGNTATVNVDAAETIEDVINNINAAGLNVTAGLNAEGNGINLIDTSSFPVQNLVVSGNSAADLGITGNKPGNIYGTDLNPSLSETTRIDMLNGGTGLNLDTLRIVNGQHNENIDLSRATSIRDIVNAVNNLGVDVTASINASGTRLDVNSNSAETAAVVNDVNEGTAASDLGIQGAFDVFKTLAVLEEALEKNDQTALLNMLDQFDYVLETLVEKGTEAGVRTNKLDAMHNRITVTETEISGLKSEIEDADMVEYLTKFTLQQTALEAIMTASSQSVQISLLNFLR
jgi:flagellar hook-associated protein 3